MRVPSLLFLQPIVVAAAAATVPVPNIFKNDRLLICFIISPSFGFRVLQRILLRMGVLGIGSRMLRSQCSVLRLLLERVVMRRRYRLMVPSVLLLQDNGVRSCHSQHHR